MSDSPLYDLTSERELRFLAKVSVGHETGCWLWNAGRTLGYGSFRIRHGVSDLAHRISYRLFRGAIPDGKELHHVCGEPACVNPDHLLPVTRREHIALTPRTRPTHCPHGHEYTPENSKPMSDGRRACRECHRIRSRAAYQSTRTRARGWHEISWQGQTAWLSPRGIVQDERGRFVARLTRRELRDFERTA